MSQFTNYTFGSDSQQYTVERFKFYTKTRIIHSSGNKCRQALTCGSKPASVSGNVVSKYDWPHARLAGTTLSHQQDLNNSHQSTSASATKPLVQIHDGNADNCQKMHRLTAHVWQKIVSVNKCIHFCITLQETYGTFAPESKCTWKRKLCDSTQLIQSP